MSGTGTTMADGTLQLGASGDTDDVEYLTVRTLDVAGGGTLEPLDTLEQSYGSTFVNTATDTLDVGGGVSWQSDGDGTATIDNQGALVVGAGMQHGDHPGGRQLPASSPAQGRSRCFPARWTWTATASLRARSRPASRSPPAARSSSAATSRWKRGQASAARASSRFPAAAICGSRPVLRTTSQAPRPSTAAPIEFDDSAETGTLNESSGDLTGPGTLTVSGGDGLDRRHDGRRRAPPSPRGPCSIGLPGDTNDDETLDGRTLTNAGTATWAGGGALLAARRRHVRQPGQCELRHRQRI